jgi:hypothetical protein
MSKPKKPVVIPISSKLDDLTYNKRSAGEKHKAMGGSDLIQRKFYGGESDD